MLVAVAGINMLAAFLLAPAVKEAMDGVPGALTLMLWMAALASPLVASLKGLLFAAIAWCTATLAGSPVPLRRGFLVGILGEAIIACSAVFTGMVIRVRGAVHSPADLVVPQGLDLFMEIGGGVPLILVEHTGIFYILWAAAAYLGLRKLCQMGRWPAVATVGGYWLVLVAMGIIRQASL
ncbi:MAG: hypothetical protein H0X64_07680 [Gemmatimonadaceae bacterium]|nr:hypothetical protein [Gemmatimonadaceae bacterium]